MGSGFLKQALTGKYLLQNAQSLVRSSGARRHDMDVWRTLAMFSVYIFHCYFYARYSLPAAEFETFYSNTPYIFKWVWSGDRGVDLFFVLSGFLISRHLFSEYRTTEAIDLKRFYSRRLLRLMPVYVLAMVVYLAIGAANKEQLWANALFINNFLPVADSAMAWTWSLAVEEQFYLALPLAIVILLSTARRPLVYILALCLCSLLMRAFLLANNPEVAEPETRSLMFDGAVFNQFFDIVYNNLYSRFGELLVGVLGGYLTVFHYASLRDFYKRSFGLVIAVIAFVIIVGLLFCGGLQFDQNSIVYLEDTRIRSAYIVVNRLVFSVSVLAIMLYFFLKEPESRGRESCIASAANHSTGHAIFWVFYARLSYSIYVFHPFIIYPVFQALYQYCLSAEIDSGVLYFCLIPVASIIAMAVSTAVAILVYSLVEKPFLDLSKARLNDGVTKPAPAIG